MIKLDKRPTPQVIIEHGNTWTTIWVDHISNGTVISDADKSRYRHHDIKSSILKETSEKCAYCESKLTHTYPGDVEHILPKRKRPDLFVKWDNLTLGCNVCNTKKGDYYSETEPLINPNTDDPQGYLKFHGALVFHMPGSMIGERTILHLELDRTGLVERRTERINSIKQLIDRWNAQNEGHLKTLLFGEIIKELSVDREYCATLRAFAREHANIEVTFSP